MHRTITLTGLAAILAATFLALPMPARAQIGTIFSDPVPRPPGNIPRRGEPTPSPDDEEEEIPELPRGRVLPAPPTRAMPPGQGAALPGPVQSQPLAPPPGTTVIPQNPPVAAVPPGGQPGAAPGAPPPPGQRQPQQKGAPANGPQNAAVPPNGAVPQAPPTLQPGDEVVTEPPAQKIQNKKATFSGLDKITGRIINFDEQIGETVQFGALRVKTDACYTRPATEATNTDAFVEVDEITLQGEVKRIFSGWMFSASPGLHGVEHPIYDIWLSDCKDPETTVVNAAPDPAKPAAQAPPPQRRAPRQTQPRPPAGLPPQQTQQIAPPPPPPPPPPQQGGGPFGIFR